MPTMPNNDINTGDDACHDDKVMEIEVQDEGDSWLEH